MVHAVIIGTGLYWVSLVTGRRNFIQQPNEAIASTLLLHAID